jgi:hypothetical protein
VCVCVCVCACVRVCVHSLQTKATQLNCVHARARKQARPYSLKSAKVVNFFIFFVIGHLCVECSFFKVTRVVCHTLRLNIGTDK